MSEREGFVLEMRSRARLVVKNSDAEEQAVPGGAYHLTRVDPSRNVARWYALSVEVTLFEDWACRRAYGRIGGRGAKWGGRIMLGLHATRQAAEAELADLLRRKVKRGYRPR